MIRRPALTALTAACAVAVVVLISFLYSWEQSRLRLKQLAEFQSDLARIHDRQRELRRRQYVTQMELIGEARFRLRPEDALQSLRHLAPHRNQEDVRGFEWYYLYHEFGNTEDWMSHDSHIASMDLSPDGLTLAVGYVDRRLELREAGTGRVRVSVPLRNAAVQSLDFSDDGELIVAGGVRGPNQPGEYRIWRSATGELIEDIPELRSGIPNIHFTPDPRYLLITYAEAPEDAGKYHGYTQLYDRVTKSALATVGANTPISFASEVLNQDEMIISRGRDLEIWNAQGKQVRALQSHTEVIESLALSPNRSLVASSGRDSVVKCFDLSANSLLSTFYGHEKEVYALAFSPDGRFLVSGGLEGLTKVWDMARLKELLTLDIGLLGIRDVCFSKDGAYLFIGCYDGKLLRWPFPVPRRLPREAPEVLKEGCEIRDLAFSPDNRLLICIRHSNQPEQSILVRDARSGDILQFLPGHQDHATCVSFAPGGSVFVTGSVDSTIKVWDATSFEQRGMLSGASQSIRCIEYSNGGRMIAAGGNDQHIRIWDAHTHQLLWTLRGCSEAGPDTAKPAVRSLAFSASGRWLACGSEDHQIRIWDLHHLQNRNEITPAFVLDEGAQVWSIAISPDEAYIASTGNSKQLRIWELATGKLLHVLEGHHAGITSIAFSHDGRTLASGDADGIVRLWHARLGKELLVLPACTNEIMSVTFSPDDESLLCGARSGEIKVWRAPRVHRHF